MKRISIKLIDASEKEIDVSMTRNDVEYLLKRIKGELDSERKLIIMLKLTRAQAALRN